MKIVEVNGVTREVPEDVQSVDHLLKHLGIAERILIVELNRTILEKNAYDQPIHNRDQIEIIHFVGGG
ncbi:sulfur carrier protein [Sporosarcina luteola]|nr:sulfur carrier protein [Sporosarcina luteola]